MSSYFDTLVLGQNFVELPKSTIPASATIKNGMYPFFCSSNEVKRTNVWVEDAPTVLMGTGGVASVNYGDEKFSYSTDTWGIRSSSEKLSTEYLYRIIQLNLDLIGYIAFEGSGLKHLRKGFVKKLKVQVPNNSRQFKIIEILDTIDSNIEQTEVMIEKYKLIKDGMMQDFFTRGVLPNGSLRPSREEAAELYKETPIGWMPIEWDVDKISNVSDFITSGSRGWADYYNIDGAIFIRIGNLTREHPNFRWTNIQRVKLPKSVEGTRTRVQEGDILISITADLGMIAVANSDIEEAYVNQHISLIRSKHNLIDCRFTAHYLGSNHAQNIFQIMNDGGSKAGLNLPTISNYLIPIPKDNKEAEKIRSILDKTDQTIKSYINEKAKLEKLRSALMNDLLLGKVRVDISKDKVS